jgi:hypothetical protein
LSGLTESRPYGQPSFHNFSAEPRLYANADFEKLTDGYVIQALPARATTQRKTNKLSDSGHKQSSPALREPIQEWRPAGWSGRCRNQPGNKGGRTVEFSSLSIEIAQRFQHRGVWGRVPLSLTEDDKLDFAPRKLRTSKRQCAGHTGSRPPSYIHPAPLRALPFDRWKYSCR